jgi:biotin carboxylase
VAARLYLIAGKVTDSVTYGFLPAAHRLGLPVTILTDRVADHRDAYANPAHGRHSVPAMDAAVPGPGATPAGRPPRTGALPDTLDIAECDVTDFRAVVAAVSRTHQAAAIFSNSDHLQTQTALAAGYFGLPGKDWRAALHTKDKAMARARLGRLGRGAVAWAALEPGDDPAAAPGLIGVPFPYVVKPREGVASEDVFLVGEPAELAARCREIWLRRPGAGIVVEEFLTGSLHTLETLGDGRTTAVLGSFHTTLSDPPHFVERRLEWAPQRVTGAVGQVLDQLDALGVGFGACHTEFMVDAAGTARLVEVNYRIIGDHCDFLLADLLGVPIFDHVLRVHLGESLPRRLPHLCRRTVPPTASGAASGVVPRGHALVDSVIADGTGMLAAAPGPIDLRTADGVRLTYRPLRTVGEWIARTNTNRDYLGMIRAIGPDRHRVEAATARFRAAHRWEIIR